MVEVLPLAHPAFIVRGKWGHRQFSVRALRDLRLRCEASPEARPPLPEEPGTAPLPQTMLHPTKAAIIAFVLGLPVTSPEGVAIDIEAAGPHVRQIGLARWDESYLSIMVLREGGEQYWERGDLRDIVSAMVQVFPTVPLWFQNGQNYDIPELLELGFPESLSDAYARGGDTMFMMRHAYQDAPADLQFIGVQLGSMMPWKRLAKAGTEDEQEGK